MHTIRILAALLSTLAAAPVWAATSTDESGQKPAPPVATIPNSGVVKPAPDVATGDSLRPPNVDPGMAKAPPTMTTDGTRVVPK